MQRPIIPALLTPFDDTGINEKSLRELVEVNIRKGVTGFYVCGSTGESILLSHEDRKRIVEIVADQVSGRVDIIVQIGAIGTALSIDLGRHALETDGVKALSSVPPFYYKFSEEEIVGYYTDLASELGAPLIPYNFPKLAGITLTPEIIKKIRKRKEIVGLKFTSNNFYDLERIKSSHPDLILYNGFDEMFLAGLSMGADGAIGSTFNFMAEKFIKISDYFSKGMMHEALDIQRQANEVIEELLNIRCFMAAEKYVIEAQGIPFGTARKPFGELSDEEKDIIDDLIKSGKIGAIK